ncbi:hypothetical protein CP533_1806 [Ophiocordyceps camponoti-saundersi (nom. inval.)]|nr:hypothetical protein CP533_1806 [Ophiocordyceps camponoti-saundersi (nom. inval.)]
MAPVKASRTGAGEDHRPETGAGAAAGTGVGPGQGGGGPKERVAAVAASSSSTALPVPSKMRRVASQTGMSQLIREAAAAPTSTPVGLDVVVVAPTLNWPSFERHTLDAYCRQHQLNAPSSFSSSYHQRVLSQPGSIGLCSPTMVARRKSRRQSKEQLAMAVRKHFNGMGIQENDVMVDFIHRVRCEKAVNAANAARVGSPDKDPRRF